MIRIFGIVIIVFSVLWEASTRLRVIPTRPPSILLESFLRSQSPNESAPDLPTLFSGHKFVDSDLALKGSGTGVIIRSDGHIFTNAHVVRGCEKVVVKNRYGSIQANVLKVSDRADVALLRLSLPINVHSPRVFFPLADPVPAERVKVFGFPLGDLIGTSGSFSEGIVNTDRTRDPSLFQVSAQVHSGNSGSAIVNGRGELVGLVTGKIDAIRFAEKTGELVQGINFGVKARELALLLPMKVVERPRIGALEPIGKWFSPQEERIALELIHYSVRVDCMAASRPADIDFRPRVITPPRESPPAESMPRYGQVERREGAGIKRQSTALRIVSIENLAGLWSFFVHNGGQVGVFAVRIGYSFAPGGKCSSDISDYDGVALVEHYIPAGVTARIVSLDVPESARGFCALNSEILLR